MSMLFSFAFTELLQITLKSPGMKNACCLLAVRKADFCKHVAISSILSWEFTASYLQGTETTL